VRSAATWRSSASPSALLGWWSPLFWCSPLFWLDEALAEVTC